MSKTSGEQEGISHRGFLKGAAAATGGGLIGMAITHGWLAGKFAAEN